MMPKIKNNNGPPFSVAISEVAISEVAVAEQEQLLFYSNRRIKTQNSLC